MKTSPFSLNRRRFLGNSLLLSAAVAFSQSTVFLASRGWLESAEAATHDVLHDTFNGLLAFVVPGSDVYSITQGTDTIDPGGVDAGVTDTLIALLDDTTPFLPNFSAQIAAVLNGLALVVNNRGIRLFSELDFAEKVAVFQIMDATDELKLLAGVLPVFVAFLCYSEGSAFDSATRSLTEQPIGWQISNYQGTADGRDEFRGYFASHRTSE